MGTPLPDLLKSPWAKVLGGLLLCWILFAWMTWPLPQFMDAGKVSSHRPEIGPPRQVIAGDHLQLMYHFELLQAFITGEAPWFHNLYEFNTGDDAATKVVDFYYLPFSFIYAVFSMNGHSALGWNMASFLSVVFGVWGMWKLTGQFKAPLVVRIFATLVGAALPYRWLTLLHGSPTGFAMMYVPWTLYGLHRCVVERKISGGWLAGVAFLLSAWGDIHTFFFTALLVPPWTLYCFFMQEKWSFKLPELIKLAKVLSGFIIMGIIVVLQAGFIRAQLSDGTMKEGRAVEEVALFSPSADALIDPDPDHPWNRIYLTYSVMVGLAVAIGWMIKRLVSAPKGQKPLTETLCYTGVLLAVTAMIVVSLGPSIALEWGPKWWNFLTTVIPPYEMIRQPAKVFSGLTPLLGLALVLPFAGQQFSKKASTAVAGLFCVIFLFEVAGRIDPTISLMDKGNDAYAAIVDAAEVRGEVPRAMAIVLWPGDSHWSSLYQYYAVKHRLRLINGYRPNVPKGYPEEIFQPFSPMNQGWASHELLDRLLEKGIRYLILHEDAFPEQVSPFAVGTTLSNLLKHPRIKLMEQDFAVWSFEVLEDSDNAAVIQPGWDQSSPSMLWPLAFDGPKPDEGLPLVIPQPDETALRGHLARLKPGDSPITIYPYPTYYRKGLSLWIRMRGTGGYQVDFSYSDDGPILTNTGSLTLTGNYESEDWEWIQFKFPAYGGFFDEVMTQIRCIDVKNAPVDFANGPLELDAALMTENDPPLGMNVGENVFFSGPSLFRAGHTSLEENAVILNPSQVPYDEVVYGPRLPFSPGNYRATLKLKTDATSGQLGEFRLRDPSVDQTEKMPVLAGETPTLDFTITNSLPAVFAFRYFRNADIAIQGIEVERLPDTP